ncbi:MAG: enolase C-terminal domain-like protein [Acidimicrobiales bacterium]
MTSRADAGAPEVVEVELVRVRVPLVRPHWSAHGTEVVRDVALVRIALADGNVGWGECGALARPTYTAEYTDGAWAVLRTELGPALLAGHPPGVVGHPMAVAAVEAATIDAELRRTGRALAVHLAALHGGQPTRSILTTAVVSRADRVADVMAAVAAHVDAGVAMVKVKVTPAAADVAAIEAVRANWPDLVLAADANGTADQALVARLDRLGLAYLEQPAPADALVTSAALAQRTDTPIALDESVTSRGTLDAAIALRSGSVLNVKPARVGGLEVAAHLVAAAVDGGWHVFVGGMLETGVGRAAAVAVAVLPGCALPTDLGPSSRYFATDITDPLVVDQAGRLMVPTGAGIGRVPRAGRVDEFSVDRFLLTR